MSIPYPKLTLNECAKIPKFNPSSLELPNDFVLTSYAKLKG